jgi:hypothetical protein
MLTSEFKIKKFIITKSINKGESNMNTQEAWNLVGGLSKPSKMPGWSIGFPAKECNTGSKLVKIKNSVCEGCYALKGCYVFPVVQAAQYRRLAAIKNPYWVAAMSLLINSKKPDVFRWHDSGDVQDEAHLFKIFEVCENTPTKKHWMPTREAWTKKYMHLCIENGYLKPQATSVKLPGSRYKSSDYSKRATNCRSDDMTQES